MIRPACATKFEPRLVSHRSQAARTAYRDANNSATGAGLETYLISL